MLVKYQVLADGGVPANTALRDCIESEPGHLIASANFLCNLRLLDLITDWKESNVSLYTEEGSLKENTYQ